MMSCDNQIMYLISEITCLEAQKVADISDSQLYEKIEELQAEVCF